MTRTSLDHYQKEFPDCELTRTGVQGRPIHLQEFEVVLEYITAKPAIHFYIKRFSIGWSHGRQRISLGKKLNNDRAVSSLLQSAFKKANEVQMKSHSLEWADGGQPDNASIESQSNANSRSFPSQNALPDVGISQEFFVSQVPAARPEIENIGARDERHNLTYETEILGHLGSRSDRAKDDTVINNNDMNQHDTDIRASQRNFSDKMKEQPHDNKYNSKKADRSSTSGDHLYAPTSLSEGMPRVEATWDIHGFNGSANLDPPTGARVDENGVSKLRATMDVQGFAPEASNAVNSETEGTEAQTLVGANKQSERARRPNNLNPFYPDPWAGLSRIRSHDIRIPKDQKYLLEDKRCWVPPSPGMHIPRGHVPPSLLNSWNISMLRRNRLTQKKESTNPVSGTPFYEMSLSPSPGSGSEVDSEGEALSWSSSPVQHAVHNELPADSSPAQTRRAPERRSPSSANELNSRGTQPSQETGNRTSDSTKKKPGTPHKSTGEFIPNVQGSSHLYNEKAKTIPSESRHIASPQNSSDESDGSDDDSAMDTSVPCPLGVSSQNLQQASQSEQEITSSGPSLPDLPRQEQIQVLETPAANLSPLRPEGVETSDNGKDGTCAYSSQRRSSQSQIFNTYGSNEHEGKGHTSQEILNSSLEDETGSNIHVTGTQVSNENWSIQQPAPQSSSALVLDSPERAHLEASASLSVPTSQALPSQPSQPFSSSHEIPFTQSDDGIHDLSAQNPPRVAYSQNITEGPSVPTLKRTATKVEGEQSPPPKRHKPASLGDNQMGKGNEKQTPNTAMRRESYIKGPSKPVDALNAYEKFQSDYPAYSGDFTHFAELCSRLQALRAQGKLTRSFLWDDFMIMHLKEYQRYIEECDATDTKPLAYEDYFTSNFSKPSYRRRSLTASTIDLCAAQCAPPNRPSQTPRSSAMRGDVDSSFTQSLVNKFSHLHARSFGSPTENSHTSDGVNIAAIATNSPLRKSDRLSADQQQSNAAEEQPSRTDFVPSTPPFSTTGQGEATSYDKPAQNAHEIRNSDDEDTDLRMEKAHRAPSVDLGDESDVSASKQKSPGNEFETSSDKEDEAECINENWFESLRHIRPSGPVWSDGPNTPFKAWARADLNVLSERRRRGGRYLAVDECGVIQRYTTTNL